MTGRARGRSRGRARSTQAEPAPRPGAPPSSEEAPQPAAAPQVARGRGRAPMQTAPAPSSATSELSGLGEKMSGMTVSAPGEQRPRRDKEESFLKVKRESATGTYGHGIKLRANFFKVLKKNSFKGFFQYMVAYDPPIESKNLKFMLLKDHAETLGTVRAFDGMILFLPKRLEKEETVLTSIRRRDNEPVRITIRLTNEIPFDSPTTLQVLNIIFRRILGILQMEQIGRSYFSEKRKLEVEKFKLQLWPGYNTAIHLYESGTLLNIDTSHKVMHKSSVLDKLYELYNSAGEAKFYNAATKMLVGETVLTKYNNKTYKIDDIDWNSKPSHTFSYRDGEISYADYYKKMYDMDVQDMEQPLLVSNPKKRDIRRGMTTPALLLPEFCILTGLSDEMRSNFQVMKELAVHTRMAPEPRACQLQAFINEVDENPEASKQLEQWNLEFDKNLVSIDARNIASESIFQKDCKFSYKVEDADWSRDMRGKNVISAIPLRTWLVLYTSRDAAIAQDFVQTLERVNPPMGIKIDKPEMEALQNDRADSYLRAIKDRKNSDTQMVVCIVPNNRKDRYDAIKKYCCVDNPVPSQVVVSRTLSKKQMLMSVCTKIGIQLNCKLGGEVWAVEVPVKNIMVIGIDVYHDSLTKGKSIVGFVASTNATLTRYYSRIIQQQSGMEIIDGLKACMAAALKKYNEINQTLPDRIIVYRDGVGDGQVDMVAEHEVPQMRVAASAVNPGYNPKFACIIVKKRINAKFFFESGRNLANPPPGTVIDGGVTNKDWYDFFLVSQSVRQGTVSPTNYHVIFDTSGFKPDHFQRLTYKLTHLYYNWQGTIRVPAPCQYAHKLAFLVGQSVHVEPDIALSDRLFYL